MSRYCHVEQIFWNHLFLSAPFEEGKMKKAAEYIRVSTPFETFIIYDELPSPSADVYLTGPQYPFETYL